MEPRRLHHFLSVFREQHPFKAGAAMVPVTNLVFRLGPGPGLPAPVLDAESGLPSRSAPLHRTLAALSRRETEGTASRPCRHQRHRRRFCRRPAGVDACVAARLAETKVYVDPVPGPASGGHAFNRRVNATTLERDDSPDQRNSWNRTWTFFESHAAVRRSQPAQAALVGHSSMPPRKAFTAEDARDAKIIGSSSSALSSSLINTDLGWPSNSG